MTHPGAPKEKENQEKAAKAARKAKAKEKERKESTPGTSSRKSSSGLRKAVKNFVVSIASLADSRGSLHHRRHHTHSQDRREGELRRHHQQEVLTFLNHLGISRRQRRVVTVQA